LGLQRFHLKVTRFGGPDQNGQDFLGRLPAGDFLRFQPIGVGNNYSDRSSCDGRATYLAVSVPGLDLDCIRQWTSLLNDIDRLGGRLIN
jgi:hypothetical protein